MEDDRGNTSVLPPFNYHQHAKKEPCAVAADAEMGYNKNTDVHAMRRASSHSISNAMAEQVPVSPHHEESDDPESRTPEERLARLKTEYPDVNLDSVFGYGMVNDNDHLAMYIGYYARNRAEEDAMNAAFNLGAEAHRHRESSVPPEPIETRGEEHGTSIEAYNLSADIAGHPHYVAPPDATPSDTAAPDKAPVPEPAPATRESGAPAENEKATPASAEKTTVIISLNEIKDVIISQLGQKVKINNLELTAYAGGLRLDAELNAGAIGGKIVLKGDIINNGNEIAIRDLDIQARSLTKGIVEKNLSRFYPEIKTYFEERFGEPINSIQITASGLELTFAPAPTPATTGAQTEALLQPEPAETPETGPIAEQFANLVEHARNAYPRLVPYLEWTYQYGPLTPARQAEAEHFTEQEQNDIIKAYWLSIEAHAAPEQAERTPALQETGESADPEIARLTDILDAAREEYARHKAAAEKQGKKSPREHAGADETPTKRINLMREDLTSEPVGNIREAEKAYREALNALRTYKGELLQREITTPSGARTKREVRRNIKAKGKEMKKVLLASTMREADELYDLKTAIQSEEWTRARGERFKKHSDRIDIDSLSISKKDIAGFAGLGVEAAKEIGALMARPANWYRNLPASQKLFASSLLFLGSSGEILMQPETEPVSFGESAFFSVFAAALTESSWHGLQRRKAKKEVLKATKEQGAMLEALLNADNSERLNDMVLHQATGKSGEKTKRAIAGAAAGLIGYMTSKILGS